MVQETETALSSMAMRQLEFFTAILITMGVMVLHLIAATSAGPLWRDEANTVGLATLPRLADVWKNLQFESFPMLWILILHEFGALLGPMNDRAFRALGFVVGLVVVAALWYSARIFRYSFPLFSLALLAMSPSLIVWGDSARAYGFGILLILLTAAMLWRFIEQPTAGRFAAAAVSAIASVHTLYYNSVMLLALCAGAVAVCAVTASWKKASLVVIIGALAAVSLLPYTVPRHDSSSWTALAQIAGYDLGLFREKLEETVRPAGPWSLSVWVGSFVLATIVGVRAVRLPEQLGISQKHREVALFSLVTMVTGVLGTFLFLKRLSFPTQPWYYLTLLALIAVCVDAIFGLVARTPSMRIARICVAIVLACASLLPASKAVRVRLTNVDLAASRLRDLSRPGDVVLVNQWYYGVSFDRYYRGPPDWMTIPPIGSHRLHRYDIVKQKMMLPDQTVAVRAALDRAGDALRAGHHVFVVGRLEFPSRTQPLLSLPPAPLPGELPWPSDLYAEQWSIRLGDFLRQHSTALRAIPIKADRPISRYENLDVFVAEGWRP